MTDRSHALQSLEDRLRWLVWAKSPAGRQEVYRMGFGPALPCYVRVLESGSHFYMSPTFCDLVDQARRSVPDDLRFDVKWLHAPTGFMRVAKPFEVPALHALDSKNVGSDTVRPGTIHAIGWERVPAGEKMFVFPYHSGSQPHVGESTGAATQFTMFHHDPDGGPGFHAWSYFIVEDDSTVGERVRSFEETCALIDPGSEYAGGRAADMLHEIRWCFTAMHIMSQRLTTTVRHEADRATRRRMEGAHPKPPLLVEVVTLRRLEQDRKRDPKGIEVDWQWQWWVTGHWRHYDGGRRVWIDTYIKGPEDKPLKSAIRIFSAER